MFNGMPNIPGMSATDHILQGSKGDREWLFCIPIQVGPTTPYARNVSHWMIAILVIQTIICVLRFVILYDAAWAGAFWMALVCGLGWYALKNDLNITYVCTWGLLCIVNAVFDVLGLVLPFIIGLGKLEIGKTILRICIPVSYLLGALFAWHLYHDYADTHGKAGALPNIDPMGSVMRGSDKMMNAAGAKFGMGGKSGAAKMGMAAMGGGGYGAAAGGAVLAAGATAGGAAAAANSSSWLKDMFSGASGKPAGLQPPTAEDMRAGAQQGMDNLASGANQAYSWGQDSFAKNAPYAQESFQQGQAQAQSAFFGMQGQAQAAMASGQQQARGMFSDERQQQAQDAMRNAAAQGQQQFNQGQQQASGFFARMQGQNQNPFATHDRQA